MRADIIAITGRFQPFHLDHLDLVLRGLADAEHVIIGITNPDSRSLQAAASSPHRHRPSANPFTYLERLRIIRAALEAASVPLDRFDVVPFPLDQPSVWADYIPQDALQLVRVYSEWEREKAGRLQAGGYEVKMLEGDVGRKISASDIRAAMAAAGQWRHRVPDGAVAALEAIGDDALRRRCTAVEHQA